MVYEDYYSVRSTCNYHHTQGERVTLELIELFGLSPHFHWSEYRSQSYLDIKASYRPCAEED